MDDSTTPQPQTNADLKEAEAADMATRLQQMDQATLTPEEKELLPHLQRSVAALQTLRKKAKGTKAAGPQVPLAPTRTDLPGAVSKKRRLVSSTITEPAYRRSSTLSTRAKVVRLACAEAARYATWTLPTA